MDEPVTKTPRRFPRDFIDDLRERIDIVEVIGSRVKLEPTAQGFVGLCPFHEEQTPSFNVVPHKWMYHCFGCGDGGDVFKFVMLTEGLSFQDAVDKLAEGVGVAVPDERAP